MKLFKCTTQPLTFTLVDLPRHSWHVLPPRRLQVAVTLVGVIVTAILWAVM